MSVPTMSTRKGPGLQGQRADPRRGTRAQIPAKPGSPAGSALRPTVFLHTPPGTFVAHQPSQLEQLKETCVRFAARCGVQAVDAEDLYQAACVCALRSRRGARGQRALCDRVVGLFRRELEALLHHGAGAELPTEELREDLPAPILDDPVLCAWRAELGDMEELVLSFMPGSWRSRIHAYLCGEVMSSIASREGLSTSRIQQGVARLRRACAEHRDRLAEYLL